MLDAVCGVTPHAGRYIHKLIPLMHPLFHVCARSCRSSEGARLSADCETTRFQISRVKSRRNNHVNVLTGSNNIMDDGGTSSYRSLIFSHYFLSYSSST
jgi:hypothetical protein